MKDVPTQVIGGKKVIFGKAMAMEYRGSWYVIVGPSADAVSDLWYEIHPGVAKVNTEHVRDVGVTAENYIREAFAETQSGDAVGADPK